MPLEELLSLLVKLAAMASIASILARSARFKSILLEENRTLRQRLELALWLSVAFALAVGTRVLGKSAYEGADLGLEGAMVAGLVGGYVTGLLSGILVALPALVAHENMTMPLLAGIGVFGGLMRDLAPGSDEVWRFSPFFDLNLYRFIREKRDPRPAAYHLSLFAAILVAEWLRQGCGHTFEAKELFLLNRDTVGLGWLDWVAICAGTVFTVTIPLKIWNNARNEKKLEEQGRLLVEARLAALTSQINPHFLFNTLNSVSSLIRTDPNQARLMVVKLSKVLRRLLRKHENFNTLRDELSFIEDYLAIETMRFGDKLQFEKDIAEDTLDMLVPSMLLQPLVENSIKHGLSSKVEGGGIRIHTHRNDSRLYLLVEDDGVGIPAEKLTTLLDRGIGVTNVNERLKVLFGNDYRMWIESQPGKGTRIQIEVPNLETGLAAVS